MENPPQNRICILLSCLNLIVNTNTDFLLLLGTTAEANFAGVPLSMNQEKHDFGKTEPLSSLLYGGVFVIITKICVFDLDWFMLYGLIELCDHSELHFSLDFVYVTESIELLSESI